MNRFAYRILGLVLFILGFGLGAISLFLDAGNYYNDLSLGPPNTVIQIGTSSPILSLLIFVSGASFSGGLAILLFLAQPGSDTETLDSVAIRKLKSREDDEEEWGTGD